MKSTPSTSSLKRLRKVLLEHYLRTHRDLPWRRTRDPWSIWVSEIMLQQTQVKTVVPRYQAFLDQFPTVEALAAVEEAVVCEAWAGLGFYRRARNLHKAAGVVMTQWGGVVPETVVELESLPGVGRYTAGAVASIAFGQEAPLVDGNVIRVFARLFALPGRSDDPKLVKRAWELAEKMVGGERPGDWNQALMEHGATLCTPHAPTCPLCPLRKQCAGYKTGEPAQFPATARQPKKQNMSVAFGWAASEEGVWLEQRALEGLWPGLWELPSGQAESEEAARTLLEKKLGGALGPEIATVKHTLSHRNVVARVYEIRGDKGSVSFKKGERVVEPLKAPLTSLAKKAIVAALA